MTDVQKKALWQAVKLPLRLLVLGVISWLVTYIIPTADERFAAILTLVVVIIDRYMHVLGKLDKKPNLVKGITRF